MKLLTLFVASACALLLASSSEAGAEPLLLPARALRAVASAYADLQNDPERGAPAEEFEAMIYETDDRIEIIFSRARRNGVERRGGGWFYAMDASTFAIVEKRRQK